MAKAKSEATGTTRRQVLMEALQTAIRNAIGNRNSASCTPTDIAVRIAEDDFEVLRIFAAFGHDKTNVSDVVEIMEEAV